MLQSVMTEASLFKQSVALVLSTDDQT